FLFTVLTVFLVIGFLIPARAGADSALKKYVIYSESDPFPGYIVGYGKVRIDMEPDGSTTKEYLDRLHEKGQWYLLLDRTAEFPDPEQVKYDADARAFVPLGPEDITPARRKELDAQQKKQEIADRLPDWATVENAVNNISNLEEAKAYLLKLSRVVYWDVRGKPE
ncbi:MAG: hypothetical protein JRJ54_10225, partial [Deltaproteobacteria bacterium]|nr:hypothetical protein [Deltaproteobacteria bacterium]